MVFQPQPHLSLAQTPLFRYGQTTRQQEKVKRHKNATEANGTQPNKPMKDKNRKFWCTCVRSHANPVPFAHSPFQSPPPSPSPINPFAQSYRKCSAVHRMHPMHRTVKKKTLVEEEPHRERSLGSKMQLCIRKVNFFEKTIFKIHPQDTSSSLQLW